MALWTLTTHGRDEGVYAAENVNGSECLEDGRNAREREHGIKSYVFRTIIVDK